MSCVRKMKTNYKGYIFDTSVEARWAIFFDECHVEWEYKSEIFDIGNGEFFQPTFVLHGVAGRSPEKLYVEVNVDIKEPDAKKIRAFADAGNPVLIVGKVPDGETIDDIDLFVTDSAYESHFNVSYFNFYMIDGDYFGAHPGINEKGKFELFGSDSSYLQDRDDIDTEKAYRKARQARFTVELVTTMEVPDES